MKKIFLNKVVLNMGVGKSGDPIETGKKTLVQITGKKPNARNAKKAQRDWGVRKNEPIGVAVTIRNNDAKELLKKLFEAKGDEWDKENNPNTDGDNIKFDFVPEPEGEDDILMDEDVNIKKRDGKDSGDYRTYTAPEDQGVNFGALFIIFHVNGQPDKARGYFKDIDGDVIDEFEIVSKI